MSITSRVSVCRSSTKAAAPGAEPPFTLAAFLPYRLNVLAAVTSETLARNYAERFGIGVPEWRVLATIGEFGTITAKAIGLHAHMGKVKVSRAVATLEARDLLARHPNRDDLREVYLSLTTAGEDMYRQIIPLALDFVARLTAGLTVAEQATFNDILDKLLSRMQTLS